MFRAGNVYSRGENNEILGKRTLLYLKMDVDAGIMLMNGHVDWYYVDESVF